MSLPDATRIGAVELNVRDLERAVRFYRDLLGMRVIGVGPETAFLGSDVVLLRLHSTPHAAPRARGQSGLYHVAYLLPSRGDLGRAIRHLVDARYPLQGASDHEFSEALYLADPEGNGIEIYADRARSEWPPLDSLAGGPRPMDVEGVLAEGEGAPWRGLPDGSRVGHIHLSVNDVAAADAFYADVVGFDRKMRLADSASFLSAGGYHHHVAVNSWGTRGGPPARAGTLGLRTFEVVVPASDHESILKRVGDAGVIDPAGNRLCIVPG